MTSKPHQHQYVEASWSLEGPLTVLLLCRRCERTVVVRPTKRKKKAPDGLTPERWEGLKQLAEEEELLAAFRARVQSASRAQLDKAFQRGIVPPIPTFDDLPEYVERTERRGSEPDPLPVCYLHGSEHMTKRAPGHRACEVCHPSTLEQSIEDRYVRGAV